MAARGPLGEATDAKSSDRAGTPSTSAASACCWRACLRLGGKAGTVVALVQGTWPKGRLTLSTEA